MMWPDILTLYNEVYHRDAKERYADLPESLRKLVDHWEHGYKLLGGSGSLSSRQVAVMMFVFWETAELKNVR